MQSIVLLMIITGCANEDSNSPAIPIGSEIALEPVNTMRPTPTLAPGLPTAPPPIPSLPPGITPNTPTPSPTATPTSTPTPTPLPVERIATAQGDLFYGDYMAAAEQFEVSLQDRDALDLKQQEEALFTLGVAYYQDSQFIAAVNTFNELLAFTQGKARAEIYFYLGRANSELEDYVGAIRAYQEYLSINPDMISYVGPYMAAIYQVMDDRDNAIEIYESALAGTAFQLTQIEIRSQLAQFYMEDGEFEAAAAQYSAIQNLAETEFTKGRMNYLAGNALLQAGDVEGGYAHYLDGVEQYPRAYESYLGLVVLVDAEYPVDDYQRGLVDYFANMYEPAIVAFNRSIEQDPESYPLDTHLYLAHSYEGIGNLEEAIKELDKYAQGEPGEAIIERAKLQARAGDRQAAVEEYLDYLKSFPDGEDAPFAAWWAAALTERMGDLETAAILYRNLAENYPLHEDAPEALFRAGWLAYELGDLEMSTADWQKAALIYPNRDYGATSLFWLFKTEPFQEATPVVENTPPGDAGDEDPQQEEIVDIRQTLEFLATRNRSDNYYAIRSKDLVNGVTPFTRADSVDLSVTGIEGQDEAEDWLREKFGLVAGLDVSLMGSDLSKDSRLIVGSKLWRIGLLEQAKRELESLRKSYTQDPLSSYQLALFFKELGLYRSSILAATSLLTLSGETVFEAPKFIGRLAFPIYYVDLILPLAQRYEFDPVLQFSLVRQESLFESFARSGAAAQGLAQVIPDTGAFIAQRLDWPDYKNEDLYKPYVGLAFGAYYLDLQLRTFDNHVHIALSAYNGGPGNAARWYEIAGDDFDAYLEAVDFSETRLYIERIYVGYVIYNHLYSE